ncbi:MAG: sugar ABC transporter permease, partial [Lachnospiraceae bacterium]
MDKKKASISLQEYGMFLALIAIFIIFNLLTGGKNSTSVNINNLVMQNGYVVILATGMLLCVLTG